MASSKSGTGMKPRWPGRESHFSTGSESDVKLTVDSNLQLESSTKKPPSRAHVPSQQVAPPTNRPKKDITFEEWNPMEDDYNDKSFNNYNRGPAAGLSGIESGRPASKKTGKFSLFVGGLPTEMTEEGLSNLFSHVCDILRVNVCQPRDENSDTTYGFVDIPSVKDGEEAIRRLDGHLIRNRRLKVSFKREKERTQVEMPNSRRDSPEEWDPPLAKSTPASGSMPAQITTSKTRPSGSGGNRKSSSGGSDTEGCRSSDKSRKPPQLRRLEDRYGTSTKPKATGEESKVKIPTDSVKGQKKGPVREQVESVSGAGNKKIESPLQTLLKKMKSPNKNEPDPETIKDKVQILASIQQVGQKVNIPEVKGSEKAKAGSPVGREIDFSKSSSEATSDSSVKQEFAEKLRKAGIVVSKESQPSAHSRLTTCPTSKIDLEDVKGNPYPHKLDAKPLTELGSDGRESAMSNRGQGESPAVYNKAVACSEPHEKDGILGAAPQELVIYPANQAIVPHRQPSQSHSPAPVSGATYCSECAAHDYYETGGHGGFHSHSHPPHHHHHTSQPRNGPCKVVSFQYPYREGYPVDEPCQTCHQHSHPYPNRPGLSPPYNQGPHYGPDTQYPLSPPYGAFPHYGGVPTFPPHHSYPTHHGHYEGRDMYQRGYPPRHLGSARYQNSGYQRSRPRFIPSMRSKPEPPTDFPKISTKTPKPLPKPEDHSDEPTTKQLSKAIVETDKSPPANGSADGLKPAADKAMMPQDREPAAGNQGATNTQHSPAAKQTIINTKQAKEALASAPPTPEKEPSVPSINSVGISTANGDGQRSMHKGRNPSQPGSVDPKPCTNCSKPGLLRCGHCKCTYCSKDCQKDHWPSHKHQCRKVTSPEGKSSDILHSGMEGQFMARNLPFETPDSLEMEVLVTQVDCPSVIWVQLVQRRSVECFSEITNTLKCIYIDPPNTAELSLIPKVGGVCAAQYTEDSNWYRAEVVSADNDQCTVRLIDFGTMDTVSKASLRKLHETLLKFPKQALRCSLSNIKPLHAAWSKEATTMVQSLVNKDDGCNKAKFKGQGAEGREIEIYSAEDNRKTISSILIEAGLAESTSTAIQCQPVTPAPPPSLGSVLDGLTVGMRVDICVSQVDSPGCFYANLTESAGALLELDLKMNECYVDMPPTTGFRPLPGELCAARFSENNLWYRAVTDEPCSSIQKSTLPVTFIDYGNSETISVSECRPLESSLAALPRQAVPCRLAGVRLNTDDKWLREMAEAFKEWLVDGRASIVVKSKSVDNVQVDIFSPQSEEPNTSFNALLQHYVGICEEDGVANQVASESCDSISTNRVVSTSPHEPITDGVPRSLPVAEHPHSEFRGFVTVVNDPGDFYLQVDSEANREAFGIFSEHLNTRYALQDFAAYKPSVGEFCATIYTDKAWYRALVVDVMAPESAFKVLFVDYGNVEVLPSDRIRQLEDRFYEMPVMALHCSLTCVRAPSSDNGGLWNEAATRHFIEKVLNKPCQVSVVKCEGSKCEVELLYPSNSMNELTSVKRDLIQHGWALPKGSPSPNQVHTSESGDHKRSSQKPTATISPDMNQSGDTSSGNPVVAQSALANPNVASLPAAKLPTEDVFGLVTVVGNHGDVYIQFVTDAEAIQFLMESLGKHYMQTLHPFHLPKVGDLCAVKYNADNAWYRGQIVGCSAKDVTVEVLFVDFGNTETVSEKEIQKLEEQFTTTPQLALYCCLSCLQSPSGDKVWHTDATEYLKEKLLEKLCKVHVTKHGGNVCEVEIHYSNDDIQWLSINEELIEKGLAKPIGTQSQSPGPSGDHRSANREQPKKTNPVMSPAIESEHHIQSSSSRPSGDHDTTNQHSPRSHSQGGLTNDIADVKSGGTAEAELAKLPDIEPPPVEFTGILTSVCHPCDFYLQIKNEDHIQLSRMLREELNKHYRHPNKRPLVPKVGELCAAKYSADNEWYRALTLEHVAPESAFSVMFVDYGNCEVVPTDRLQKLEGDFLEVPRLSHHCCLSGVMSPSGDKQGPWGAEAASFISTELIERDKDCLVKLVKHDGKVCEVELHYSSDDGSQSYNLKDELLRKGLAKPITVATSPTKESRLLASSVQKASLPSNSPIVVMVNEVVSPQEFYCQRVIVEEIEKLQSLMERIKASSDKLLAVLPVVGDLCLAQFTVDNTWYRAEILKIKQADQRALVHYIDFGNKEPLPWSRLGAADRRFAELPMQAIQCGLAGVSSVPSNEETKAFLRDLMTGDETNPKRLEATLCGMSADGASLLQLVDVNTGEDINQLARDHFRSRQPATSPSLSKNPQLTPSFSPATPRVTTSDPSKLEALKQEMELKKKMLEAQIEAQRRELAEVEQLRASLEQGY